MTLKGKLINGELSKLIELMVQGKFKRISLLHINGEMTITCDDKNFLKYIIETKDKNQLPFKIKEILIDGVWMKYGKKIEEVWRNKNEEF